MWDALTTYLPLDEAHDLAEIMDVGNSWRDAYTANGELATADNGE